MKKRIHLTVLAAGIVFLGIGLGVANRATAGGSSIQSRMTLSVLSDTITVKLAVTNTGNEDGRKIRAVLYIFGRTLESEPLDRLETGKSHTFFFDFPVPGDRRGQFAFVGEVFFHDAALTRYSALSAGTFLLRNQYPSVIIGRSPGVTLDKKGRITVHVKNTSPRPRTVTAGLYLPYALLADQTEKRFQIHANEETTVSFDLKYRYDLGGAVYPLFCVLEYEDNENRQVSLVRSVARITEPKDWFLKTRWYWLSGFGGIAVVWILYFFLGTARKCQHLS